MDGSAENRGEGTRRTDEPLPSHVREELNENDPDELEDEMAATLADWTASCGTALGIGADAIGYQIDRTVDLADHPGDGARAGQEGPDAIRHDAGPRHWELTGREVLKT